MEPDSLETQALKSYLLRLPREKRNDVWRLLFDMDDCVSGSMRLRHIAMESVMRKAKNCFLSSPGSDLWVTQIAAISHVNMNLMETVPGSGQFNKVSGISIFQGKQDRYGYHWEKKTSINDYTKHTVLGSFEYWFNDSVGFDKVESALLVCEEGP